MSMPTTGPWVKDLQVSTVRSVVHQIVVANKSGAAFWVWICNSAAGATAQSDLCPEYVAPNERKVFDYVDSPRLLTAGVYVAACPSPTVFAVIPGFDCYIEVDWRMFPANA